jgi:hypothetical protein
MDNMSTNERTQSLAEARAIIRADFLRLADLVINQVELPPGHRFLGKPGWTLEHQLTWNLSCEVRSTEGGAGIHAGLAISDDADTTQIQIEVRYLHPAMTIKDGNRPPVQSRGHQVDHSAILWVDQGRPLAGMTRCLIGDGRHVGAATLEQLASGIVARLRIALAKAQPVKQAEVELA